MKPKSIRNLDSKKKRGEYFSYQKIHKRGKCGKITYELKRDAKKQLKSLNVPNRTYGKEGELNVYYCPDCGGFHIGHTKYKE